MIQCKNQSRDKCGGELCAGGLRPRCKLYRPARDYGAYGWDVTVRFHMPINGERTYHWRGCTAAAARRKGMLKSHAAEIVAIEPITENQWIRAYGDPSLKAES